jgi:transcriptional regulator with XRE-family HTH domain
MADTTLGAFIRDARLAKGLKLRELARRLDVTPSYVSDIENDRRIPSEEVLTKIAAELDLDYSNLVARAGRLPADAERYMRETPSATALFRRITEQKWPEEDIKRLAQSADEIRGDRADLPGGET